MTSLSVGLAKWASGFVLKSFPPLSHFGIKGISPDTLMMVIIRLKYQKRSVLR